MNVGERFLPGYLLLCSVENNSFHEQIVVSLAIHVMIFCHDISPPLIFCCSLGDVLLDDGHHFDQARELHAAIFVEQRPCNATEKHNLFYVAFMMYLWLYCDFHSWQHPYLDTINHQIKPLLIDHDAVVHVSKVKLTIPVTVRGSDNHQRYCPFHPLHFVLFSEIGLQVQSVPVGVHVVQVVVHSPQANIHL